MIYCTAPGCFQKMFRRKKDFDALATKYSQHHTRYDTIIILYKAKKGGGQENKKAPMVVASDVGGSLLGSPVS